MSKRIIAIDIPVIIELFNVLIFIPFKSYNIELYKLCYVLISLNKSLIHSILIKFNPTLLSNSLSIFPSIISMTPSNVALTMAELR